jgi:hypothetical protein
MPIPKDDHPEIPEEGGITGPVDELQHDVPVADEQSTIMDQLRAKRDEQTADLVCYITVPGYQGLLKAEYGVLPTKQMGMIGKKIQRQFKDESDRQLNAIIDTLIQACQGFHFVQEDGSSTAIDPDHSGVPLTYTDPRTPGYFKMGEEVTTARACLLGVFNNNEPSILAHGMKLSRWYEDTSKDVDEGFLGE